MAMAMAVLDQVQPQGLEGDRKGAETQSLAEEDIAADHGDEVDPRGLLNGHALEEGQLVQTELHVARRVAISVLVIRARRDRDRES